MSGTRFSDRFKKLIPQPTPQAIESKPRLNKLPMSEKEAFLDAADGHFDAKEYELALKCYEHYLEHHANDVNVLFNKGTILSMLGRYEEAVRSFKLAVVNKDNDAALLNNYGSALLYTNEPKLALAQFNLALKLRPDHDNTWHNHGLAYYAMGNPAAALVSFDRALSLNPYNEKIVASRTLAVSHAPFTLSMFKPSPSLGQYQNKGVVTAKKESSPNPLAYMRLA